MKHSSSIGRIDVPAGPLFRAAPMLASVLLVAGGALAQEPEAPPMVEEPGIAVPLLDARGGRVAVAHLRETSDAGVLIRLEASALPPGIHAFHLHETGRCVPPDFVSAGGHFAPRDRSHGFLHPGGPHGGDLPNLHVPADGRLTIEVLAPAVTLDPAGVGSLTAGKGSALVIHLGADDYRSQPSGDAGRRIACGELRR